MTKQDNYGATGVVNRIICLVNISKGLFVTKTRVSERERGVATESMIQKLQNCENVDTFNKNA